MHVDAESGSCESSVSAVEPTGYMEETGATTTATALRRS